MNDKKKPNLYDLSLHYDGLLEENRRNEVEAYLEEGAEGKNLMQFFQCVDSALEGDLPDDRLDVLLSDNLKGIHERLHREEQQRQRDSISIWDWLLMPRNILAGLAGILILFGVFSVYNPTLQPDGGDMTALVAKAVPTAAPATGKSDAKGVVDVMEETAVNEAQKQVILAAANLAKRAFSNSYNYAKEQGRPLGESLTVMPQTTNLGVAWQALTSSPKTASDSTQVEGAAPLSPNERLARAGASQLAIGLGASLLNLISII